MWLVQFIVIFGPGFSLLVCRLVEQHCFRYKWNCLAVHVKHTCAHTSLLYTKWNHCCIRTLLIFSLIWCHGLSGEWLWTSPALTELQVTWVMGSYAFFMVFLFWHTTECLSTQDLCVTKCSLPQKLPMADTLVALPLWPLLELHSVWDSYSLLKL